MIWRSSLMVEKLPVYKQVLSKGLYARYYTNTMVDGVGVRNSLYVTGCLFNCVGCYNKSIQNFNNGEPFTKEIHQQILDDLEPEQVSGLTLLGGEPLLNLTFLNPLVKDVKERYGKSKTIWSWTGFSWEELVEIMKKEDNDAKVIREYLETIDILVDGRFVQELLDLNLTFRGSSNQRIIDVPRTLESKEIVLWKDGNYK